MPKIHVFEFLAEPPPDVRVCVLSGNVAFLRQLARRRLLAAWSEEGDCSQFDDNASWRDVRDELATVSLFSSGPRLVLVRDADAFISRHRGELEDYVAEPLSNGRLILEPTSFPGNTRLAKAVAKTELTVECKAPEKSRGSGKPVVDQARVAQWLVERASAAHEFQLAAAGARVMLDMIGVEFGLLEQELSRLALYADPGGKISAEQVRQYCGGWRKQTAWDMIDALLDGDTAAALEQLDKLLRAGESPQAVFGQLSWSLRRLGVATRVMVLDARQGRRANIPQALQAAGVPSFQSQQVERQLRRLGGQRARQLLQQLSEADLAIKGSHSAPARARFLIEQLVIQWSQPAAARA